MTRTGMEDLSTLETPRAVMLSVREPTPMLLKHSPVFDVYSQAPAPIVHHVIQSPHGHQVSATPGGHTHTALPSDQLVQYHAQHHPQPISVHYIPSPQFVQTSPSQAIAADSARRSMTPKPRRQEEQEGGGSVVSSVTPLFKLPEAGSLRQHHALQEDPSDTSVLEWTSREVARYVGGLKALFGLRAMEYANAMATEDIDGPMLLDLKEAELKELGLTMGHRKKLLARIADLRSAGQQQMQGAAPDTMSTPIYQSVSSAVQALEQESDLPEPIVASEAPDLTSSRSYSALIQHQEQRSDDREVLPEVCNEASLQSSPIVQPKQALGSVTEMQVSAPEAHRTRHSGIAGRETIEKDQTGTEDPSTAPSAISSIVQENQLLQARVKLLERALGSEFFESECGSLDMSAAGSQHCATPDSEGPQSIRSPTAGPADIAPMPMHGTPLGAVPCWHESPVMPDSKIARAPDDVGSHPELPTLRASMVYGGDSTAEGPTNGANAASPGRTSGDQISDGVGDASAHGASGPGPAKRRPPEVGIVPWSSKHGQPLPGVAVAAADLVHVNIRALQANGATARDRPSFASGHVDVDLSHLGGQERDLMRGLNGLAPLEHMDSVRPADEDSPSSYDAKHVRMSRLRGLEPARSFHHQSSTSDNHTQDSSKNARNGDKFVRSGQHNKSEVEDGGGGSQKVALSPALSEESRESPLDLPYYHPDYVVKCLYCPKDFFTPTQIEDYKESFRLFDKDGDGTITVLEIGTIMRSLGQKPTGEELQSMVDEFDEDGNGEIDFEEFLGMMFQKIQGASEEVNIIDAFRLFDDYGNGKICPDKLRLILSTLSDTHPLSDRPLLQKEIEAIIFHADADEQGYINYEALAHVIAAWPEDDLEDI